MANRERVRKLAEQALYGCRNAADSHSLAIIEGAILQGIRESDDDVSYDQRIAAIRAHNTTKGDLDDKLQAAWKAQAAARLRELGDERLGEGNEFDG